MIKQPPNPLLETFFNCAVDSRYINHYLQLLAQRQSYLEHQVTQLTQALQQKHLAAAELALLTGKAPPPLSSSVLWESDDVEQNKQLLQYLPAIFPGFWNVISPDELAQLIGITEKLVIPSPYPYPNYIQVTTLITQIKQLAEPQQLGIRNLCHQLLKKYTLKLHPAWLPWLLDTHTSDKPTFA